MPEDLGERTQAPSSRRRDEARQRGQVARSQDFGAGVDLTTAFILLLLFGAPLTAGLAAMLRYLLDDRESGHLMRHEGVGDLCRWAAQNAALIAAPILLILFIVTFIAQVLQVGWHPTLDPLMPRLDRLNPLGGLQRLLGPRNLIRTGLGLIKLSLIGAIVVYVITSDWPRIIALAQLDARAIWAVILAILTRLLTWVLGVLLVLGIADYMFQRWQLTRDLMMTRQEVKEEHRTMEGDPEIKGRRLRIARQIALQMTAPVVVAKGADQLAFRIREIALAHKIPIVERPPLARSLYVGVPVGKQIKPEFYEAVAEILAYVYRLQNRAA
jgi:flagellar biosynthetic protein FlhB